MAFVICICYIRNGVHPFRSITSQVTLLSSQRSETTNRFLKRRLRTIADLCDFCNVFCDVVYEWRSKENGKDHRCSKG